MKIPFDVKMLTSGASLLEQEKDSVKGWSGYCTAVGCNEK